jgi:hypothetical protein
VERVPGNQRTKLVMCFVWKWELNINAFHISWQIVSTFIEDGEQYPTAIAADYAYHNTICVTSRPSADKSSTANGHVTIYSHGGQLQGKYEVGVNPSLIDFGYVMVYEWIKGKHSTPTLKNKKSDESVK